MRTCCHHPRSCWLECAARSAAPDHPLPLLAAVPPAHGAAGIDERGLLGEKKRRKVLGVLKETDVAVVVLDVAKYARCVCV